MNHIPLTLIQRDLCVFIMASKSLTTVTAILSTVIIGICGGLSFFATNNTDAQIRSNMTSDMMRQGGMMGPDSGMGMMDGRMMGVVPGMMGPDSGMGMMDGRMMGVVPGMMGPGSADNQSKMRGMMMQNVTGSINLSSTITNAIASQVKESLSQAATTAEGAVGNNSHALAAHLGEVNGYLTYCIWVLGPDMKINMVIVDPGNGQVLSNKQIPLQHPMMSMGLGMGMGMMGPGMGMMGPGMGMMGPGMGMGMMGSGMMR
jgi:hypothetical protein